MVNYQNGKIYKLVSFQTDKIYIGSTCEKLTVRKAKHKANYKSFLQGKGHVVTAFEILKYDDVDIILLENCPCENKEQLHKKERFYIENTNNCVNKYIPTRTDKEYYEDNIEKIKKYREQNKEKIALKTKQYTEKNKNRISENKKQYYQRNKAQMQVVYTCSCGHEVRKCNKKRHERTNKHIEATKPQ
jgi:hypothetical protein